LADHLGGEDSRTAADDGDLKKAIARLAVAKRALASVSESDVQRLVRDAQQIHRETSDQFQEAHRTKADYYAPIDPKLVDRLKDLHGQVLQGLKALAKIDSKGISRELTKDVSTYGHMRLDPDTLSEAAGLAYMIERMARLVLAKTKRAVQMVSYYTKWIDTYRATGMEPSLQDQWDWLR
jgi:hypothetical protein